MKTIKTNGYLVNGSTVKVDVITDIDWEDIALFKARAFVDMLYVYGKTDKNEFPPVYKSIKEYLINKKG